MAPVSLTARFAQVPKKIPKAVLQTRSQLKYLVRAQKTHQICQVMTSPPRMFAGATSAEKTGTVTSLRPMLITGLAKSRLQICIPYPMPSRTRQAASCPQCCVTAEPRGAKNEKTAPMKIVVRRPSHSFKGSESHPALLIGKSV